MLSRLFLCSLLFGSVALCGRVAQADAVTAQQHFEAGVRAFEEQRLADAAQAFQLAYAAEPAWQLLFNLGSVYAALGEPVPAVDAFERYLREADRGVSQERREQVRLELERQRAKIGRVVLHVTPTGAEVRVDAHSFGNAPLAQPIALRAGRHVLEVVLDGYRAHRQEITVQPAQQTELTLSLPPVLVPAAPDPTPGPAREASRETGRHSGDPGMAQRIVGWTLGGAGLGGLIAGAVIFTKARNQHLEALELNDRDERTRAEQLESKAQHRQTLSYPVLGIGGALFVAGAILVWSAPRGSSANAQLSFAPWASREQAGIIGQRTF